MYLDLDEELDRIAESHTYMDDHQTWLAILWDPQMKKVFNGLTYLQFARDAARSVKRVHYKTWCRIDRKET